MISLVKLVSKVKNKKINIEQPMSMRCEYHVAMEKVKPGKLNRLITKTQVYFQNEDGEEILLGHLNDSYKL